MAKKLRIEAEIPLPEDHFEAARVMARIEQPLAEFEKALGHPVKHAVIAERAPSKKPRLVASQKGGTGHAAAE